MKDDPDFNTWFVKEIQKHACLYNHTDLQYTNRTKQEAVWQELANLAEATVPECKERWKNLRACFTRHLKHRIIEMKSGVKCKKGYYLAEHMNFILPFTRVRSDPEDKMKYFNEIAAVYEGNEAPDNLNLNIVYVDPDEENESSRYDLDVETTYGETDYKPRVQSNTQNQDDDEAKSSIERVDYYEANHDTRIGVKRKRPVGESDPDLDFFHSLMPDVKSMNDNQRRKFRIKVLTLIDEILDAPASSQ